MRKVEVKNTHVKKKQEKEKSQLEGVKKGIEKRKSTHIM